MNGYQIVSETLEKKEKQQLSEGFIMGAFIHALITFIILVVELYAILKIMARTAKFNQEWTDKFNKLVPKKRKIHIFESKYLFAFTGIDNIIRISNRIIDEPSFTEREKISILIHEYGHTTVIPQIQSAGALTILSFIAYFIPVKWARPLVLVIMGLGIQLGLIKANEFYADSYAVKQGYGRDLISLHKKGGKIIKSDSSADLTKAKTLVKTMMWIDNKLHIHPQLKDIIEMVKKHEAELKKAIETKNKNKISSIVKASFGGK